MTKVVAFELEDGERIWMEVEESAVAEGMPAAPASGRVTRGGGGEVEPITRRLDALESTLRHFTRRALAPFREVAGANVDKVTLEFGINLSGEAGIPYVTKGKAESNLKVTVECSFPKVEEGAGPKAG